mmetsp:Transcript_33823/g.101954  ORF Transcript_33823/g.101954 Transcript_33823/m.101954 type:complete len:207 (+) Transcript_33823:2331-2951(+)
MWRQLRHCRRCSDCAERASSSSPRARHGPGSSAARPRHGASPSHARGERPQQPWHARPWHGAKPRRGLHGASTWHAGPWHGTSAQHAWPRHGPCGQRARPRHGADPQHGWHGPREPCERFQRSRSWAWRVATRPDAHGSARPGRTPSSRTTSGINSSAALRTACRGRDAGTMAAANESAAETLHNQQRGLTEPSRTRLVCWRAGGR